MQKGTQQKVGRRASFSPTDWWKAQGWFYILRNPCTAYRTRDLRAHAAGLGVRVTHCTPTAPGVLPVSRLLAALRGRASVL